MDIKLAPCSSLKKGSYVVIEGAACRVVDLQTSRPGKHGHAKTRVTAVGLIDDKKREFVSPGHDNVEVPMIDKRNAQILSMQGDIINVMDSENYETFDLKVPEDLRSEVAEGLTAHYWVIMADKVLKQIIK